MSRVERPLTRRQLLGGAAALGVSSALTGVRVPTARAARRPVPLPSPAQVRADFQRMVDFGPRLTGSDSHNNYVAWLEQEFTTAGLELIPCDVYETERWLAQDFGLEVLEGSGAGAVRVAAYYPRSQETPAAGVSGPLVYGGSAPAPSVSGTDFAALEAALARYPGDLQSWARGLAGTLGGTAQGSVLLVDLPAPPPATTGIFLPPYSTYLNWPGHSEADWVGADYKRPWTVPGVAGVPTAPFRALGAIGVVFIVDASYEAFKGTYGPFESGFEALPALYVDRDTGAALRSIAAARPKTRLTLTATRQKVPTATVTAVLPGASEEVIIFNTHTDGEGFVEENGGVAFVHLARYFASLPASRRLKRTLVFAAWPGHMAADLPQAQGWINAHPEIMKRAAAALTVEHLGCTEWDDKLDGGYQPTRLPEAWAIWTTQGTMFDTTREAVIAHNLPRTALMRPPGQFGVGGAFQSYGIPQIGAIAGPYYLLTLSANGDMDKLDESLASTQIAFLADLTIRLDPIPAGQLRQGDPTLGYGGSAGGANPSVAKVCSPPLPPATPGCPRATGRLSGRTLGLVTLGMTRAQARHAYLHSSNRDRKYEDFFCLSPIGVRVGYASQALLRTLPAGERKRFEGRVVWASTSNPFYALRGVRPGTRLAAVARRLRVGRGFHVGLNWWYFAPNGSSTALLKVRHGIVEEVGIAERSLTRGRKAQLAFINSFY
ncbi:MAG TPA: hypothetical protein VGY97_00845 [Solirubrobacteraceae bacterium]|nr:hypothetical protein [Solirubrobacteraceae bacterium]